MIKSIEELKTRISHLKQEEQDEFIKWVKPFYDFYDYMGEEYGKTYEEIENESAKLSEEVLPEYLAEMSSFDTDKDSSLEFIVSISGKIYKRYAESYDYHDADAVEKSLTKFMSLLLKHQIKNG